jgi:hypothetical protein
MCSELELKLSEARGENSALQQRLETVSADVEANACKLAEVTGSAAASSLAMTKRNESLQKMVTFLLYYIIEKFLNNVIIT